MCDNPCDSMRYAICQHENGCDGPFFMPCGSTCFEYKKQWPNRKSLNYTIPDCDTCPNNKK